jgi:hypothetical protein
MLAFRRISEIIKRHEELDHDLRNEPAIRDIHRLYDAVAVKASSLFQHLSIMIAVCTFLANISGTNRLIRMFYLAETFSYMVLCFVMLPILHISTYDGSLMRGDRKVYFARSIRRRVNLLAVSLYATITLTMIVICTLAADLYFFSSTIF